LNGDKLLAGAIILDSGGLAILLDVPEIVRLGASGGLVTRRAEVDATATSTLSVLLVDDSEVTRDLLGSILRSHRYEVVEAINGKNALDLMAREKPGLVVTDLEMPVLDGFGLLHEIRSRPEWKDLPTIVFSTRGSDSDKKKAAELGADAYLVKGQFREEDLLSLTRRYLGR
jgi:CheY-like chemotaxis protein